MLNQYNELPNGKITNIDKMPLFFHQVNRIICQSLDISNFIKCHKVADKCVFFNHMTYNYVYNSFSDYPQQNNSY